MDEMRAILREMQAMPPPGGAPQPPAGGGDGADGEDGDEAESGESDEDLEQLLKDQRDDCRYDEKNDFFKQLASMSKQLEGFKEGRNIDYFVSDQAKSSYVRRFSITKEKMISVIGWLDEIHNFLISDRDAPETEEVEGKIYVAETLMKECQAFKTHPMLLLLDESVNMPFRFRKRVAELEIDKAQEYVNPFSESTNPVPWNADWKQQWAVFEKKNTEKTAWPELQKPNKTQKSIDSSQNKRVNKLESCLRILELRVEVNRLDAEQKHAAKNEETTDRKETLQQQQETLRELEISQNKRQQARQERNIRKKQARDEMRNQARDEMRNQARDEMEKQQDE